MTSIPSPETVNERVRRIRRRQKLDVRGLAELAGMDPATISRIEGGVTTPRDDTLVRLAKALGVQVAWLRDGK